MNAKSVSAIFILSLAVLAFTACGEKSSGSREDSSGTVSARVITVALEELPVYSTAMGTVEAFDKAVLSTRMMGQVRRVNVEEGDRVKAGQILLQLDSRDISSRIEQSKAMLAAAKSQAGNARAYFERIEKLYNEQSATKQALDNARTGFEAAEAQAKAAGEMVAEAESNLAYTNITAPFAGYVTSRTVQAGDLGSPGMPLVTVEMQDSLKVIATVSEQEVSLISPGQMVRVETDLPGLAPLEARVAAVVQAGDPGTRRFKVKLVLPNPGGVIRSGIFTRVLFKTGREQAIAVPEAAVVRRGQLTGVFVLDEQNRTSLRWVRLGRKIEDRIEVLSGLSAGDKVVSGELRLLREGQRVEGVAL